MKTILNIILVLFLSNCRAQKVVSDTKSTHFKETKNEKEMKLVLPGANNFDNYLFQLKGKNVGLIANQGSVVFGSGGKLVHLVDTLATHHINIKKIYSPEHGFRGTADAGEHLKDDLDVKTGIPIISLYGNQKKPTKEQLKDIDILLFDLQDVGVRFYTYISTLHYIMEVAADNNIPLIVLDRPNPNAHYLDGPLLEKAYTSFVGLHPVPVVYGMTIGEYAMMINGEKWLGAAKNCRLSVIKNLNYTHATPYVLPIKPSPNLPNTTSIMLYPSLCFFEGTNISVGRGTDKQFQVFGSPKLDPKTYPYSFVPQPNEGAKNPLFQGITCYGLNLEKEATYNQLNLKWLVETYNNYPEKNKFFNAFFNTLAGNSTLRKQIESGLSPEEIRATWQKDLENFKIVRAKYLLYQ